MIDFKKPCSIIDTVEKILPSCPELHSTGDLLRFNTSALNVERIDVIEPAVIMISTSSLGGLKVSVRGKVSPSRYLYVPL